MKLQNPPRLRHLVFVRLVVCAVLVGPGMAFAVCFLSITNPGEGSSVAYEVHSIGLQGTASPDVQGSLTWQNLDRGTSGSFPASEAWSVAGIDLAVGTNRLVVSGSDAPLPVTVTNAWDNGSQPAYPGAWTSGSNGGTGFHPWFLYTSAPSSSQGGHFLAQNSYNQQIGSAIWGLYANSGEWTFAERRFVSPLQIGQTLSLDFQNNQVQTSGGVGMYVADENYDVIWSLFWGGFGDSYYVNWMPSEIGWTDQGLHVELTRSSATGYVARITPGQGVPHVLPGTTLSATNFNAARVYFVNDDAGPGGMHNFYVNNLRILTLDESEGASCSDTVTVVRAAFAFTNEIPLFINEVMASNQTFADEDGDTPDWIELYYGGAIPLNLDGFGLSDNPGAPFKWTFPSVTMVPDSFLRIWASGKNRREPGSPLHTGYSISSQGEPILLTHADGTLLDELPARELPGGISFGRQPDGHPTLFYFAEPTPGEPNLQTAYDSLLARLNVSVPAGFYSEEFDVSLQSTNSDVVIRYTLDGSLPTEEALIYDGPISISSRAGEPNVVSTIPYLTGHGSDEVWMSPNGEVNKLTTLRARAYRPGALPSPVETRSYSIDPLSTNRYSMAVVSITTDLGNLFGGNGIYSNPFNTGIGWERPAHIEFFDESGTLGFAQDVGVRVHGGTTRNRPRKSLRVYARAEYGNAWIDYPLFPDKPVSRYKRFLLRSSGNDWGKLVFRDAMMQRLMKGQNVDIQDSRPAIVFLNGEYWGIHNIRDRYDQFYLDTHYGTGQVEDITMMENNSLLNRGDPGGISHYNALRSFLNNPGVADASDYAYVATQMDIDSFIDMQVANIYYRNTDWPNNNLRYWRASAAYDPGALAGLDGRWRWMLHDTDFGFGLDLPYVVESGSGYGPNDASHNTLAMALGESVAWWVNPKPAWSTFMLRALMQNSDFRQHFINRSADLLNTVLSSDRVVETIDAMAAQYGPEMDEHIRRWRRPANITLWSNQVQIARTFGNERVSHLRNHIIGQFPEVSGTFPLTVQVSNPAAGYVRVHSIDLLPETPGVGASPYPWTGHYFAGVPVAITAIPRDGFYFAGWAHEPASTSATLVVSSEASVTAMFAGAPMPFPVPLQKLVETGDPLVLNANDYFSHPDSLAFTAVADPEGKVGVSMAGEMLTLTPIERGEASVSLVADDGVHSPVTNLFRVLVYPHAYPLADGPFHFGAWDPDLPERVYPAHMLFLQSDRSDTLIDTPLLHAYDIAHDDYHENDAGTIGFPYNNTGRTRITGLGDDGISFINTGRGRDLGGALLALDTRAITNANVSWLGGTLLPNSRVYAIRLQYRIGVSGPFLDLPNASNQAVEYVRNATAGHTNMLPAVSLPAHAMGEPHVQLLWRYYLISGNSGPRAELRLDEIVASGAGAVDDTPFHYWRVHYFNEAELLDDEISGPLADPAHTGARNLFRFAVGLGRHDDPRPALPRASLGPTNEARFLYRRLLDPESGVLYAVEISPNMLIPASWRPLEPEDGIVETGAEPTGDGLTEEVIMTIPADQVDPALNLRLKVTLE